MKILRLALLFALLSPLPARAQAPATVLAAAATSSAPGSAPVTCLLDPGCQGSWTPASADSGAEEGLYLQFESPISAGYLQILAAGAGQGANRELRVYVNGNTSAAQGRGKVADDSGGNQLIRLGTAGGTGIQVKSLFVKIEAGDETAKKPIAIRKIALYPPVPDHESILQGQVPPLKLSLPSLEPAQVAASSILDPVSAYHPAHLFDSAYDIAWSTDGKKSDGKEESFTLNLGKPKSLSGLMVWNGYQRSAEHFKANGRVLEAEIQADALPPFRLPIADRSGGQRLSFPRVLENVRQLKFTIKTIAPGGAYKDVLISELRLLGSHGELVLPQVELPKSAFPASFQAMANRSYASFLHQPIAGKPPEEAGLDFTLSPHCDNARIRLRDNGSFVIYKGFNYGKPDSKERPANITADVLEGNWEPKGDALRIFGKKYVTALQRSEYLQESASSTPRVQIFQSEATAKPYKALNAAEKESLFAFLWAKKKGGANKSQGYAWILGAHSPSAAPQAGPAQIEAESYEALLKKLDPLLAALNPIYFRSSVLSDLLLPTDETQACWSSTP